jgi:anti-sigma factor RsiW
MNCELSMELMQRFVDDDLPQAEQDILMAHIKQCPECAASFEQLQRLSAELSNLPMVSPPFSIVDSILPKLAELDTQKASIQVAYLPDKVPHKKSLFSWKMSAGFVAAAIFFSLIAVNLSPSSKKDAGEMLNATMGIKNTAQLKSTGTVADQGEKAASDKVAPTASAVPEVTPVVPEAAPAASAESKVTVQFSESVTQKDVSAGAHQEKTIAPKQPQINDKSKRTLTKPEPAASVTNHIEAAKRSADTLKVAPVVPSPSPAPSPITRDKGKGITGEKGKGIMSFTINEDPAAPSLASEDGSLIGYVERQIVQVRTSDRNRIYTSSVQWNTADTINLIKWEDSSHLIYEVTMEDGQLKRFIVDIILKTEQQQ